MSGVDCHWNLQAAKVKPSNATVLSVTWFSSNPDVASVDGTGILATCKITVTDRLVSKLTLNKKKATLKKGKTLQLKVKTVKPADAMNRKVKWISSNKIIVTVSKNGKVKAKKKGTCYIICTAADSSGVQVKCKITVKL